MDWVTVGVIAELLLLLLLLLPTLAVLLRFLGRGSSSLPLRISGAPSRKACDVFSRALTFPTSLQLLSSGTFLRNRPPSSRMARTMRWAILGFSRRLAAM